MAAVWSLLGTRSARVVQDTTESAPSLATDGVLLSDVATIVLVLRAPAGQTFDGTGTLLGYIYVPELARWVRIKRADQELSDMTSLEEGSLSTMVVDQPTGRFMLVASGVGLSAGTTFTTDYWCVSRRINSEGQRL